jgi:lipopolysaccharide/colanic/teichoic acid biosynthesis glycosyltransferase
MYEFMKRGCDIVLSSLALLVLSPLLVPVAVILKLTGEHYIFFVQQRVGLGGRPFGLLKFATMLKDSPRMATGDITVRNDPRVLPFGRILRKAKINELPQLINVLKGDMSLIGPRPLTFKHFAFYTDHVQEVINRVRPGLSGVGSLLFRSEENMVAASGIPPARFYEEHIAPYKGTLEEWYVTNQSIGLDFLAMLLTVWVVVFPNSRCCIRLLRYLPQPDSQVLSAWFGRADTQWIAERGRVAGVTEDVGEDAGPLAMVERAKIVAMPAKRKGKADMLRPGAKDGDLEETPLKGTPETGGLVGD